MGRITTAGVITDFPLAGVFGPAGIAAGPDGNLWLAESFGDKIARLTVAGSPTEFPTPTTPSQPLGVAAGPDGNVWFTEFRANQIGRITTTGTITEFSIPTAATWNPHQIAAGPDGNLWFTENAANKIGRITPAGVVTEFPIPTAASEPVGIAAGPDGNLWFTESAANKIGRITPDGAITEFPIPTAASGPRKIAAGPDGNLWFTESSGNKIGRITTGPPPAVSFYTVTPCRVFDTRDPGGPTLGAPLTCGTAHSFAVAGKCEVPSDAEAVSLNVTGTESTARGNIRLFAAGDVVPLVSALNYDAGQTRANNAVAPLGTSGQISVLCSPSGATHVVLDVNGYFE